MTTKTAQVKCCRGGKTSCQPPACGGLECLERPRFYAGQLLTEEELNGLDAYVRAKSRLHNLHLHGWGTVCGLAVVCHSCEGWVTVEPGYAIDPCGNDVVVCEARDFDVLGAIRECREARRRQDRAACRPRRCEDGDEVETWCLVLRYVEEQARPKAALREARPGCGCGPNGGGANGGASCGGASTSPGALHCEPTRVRETYRLELRQQDGDCDCYESVAERQWGERLRRCVDIVGEALDTLGRDDVGTLGQVATTDFNQADVDTVPSTGVQFESYCQVLALVRELYRRNPGNVHCGILEQLERLDCQEPTEGENNLGYASRNSVAIRSVLSLLVQYFVDCFCHALMPACAPCCPEDDELVLACMTVRGGELERICNFSCRRFAGAFPPTVWGFHVGPWLPLLRLILEKVCCVDWLGRLLGQDFGRQAVRFAGADSFARLRFAGDAVRNLSFASLFGLGAEEEKKEEQESANLASFVGREVGEVKELSADLGIEITAKEVSALPPGEIFTTLRPARRGERLVAYTDRQGCVLGFARGGSSEEARGAQAEEVATLRAEIAALRRDVTRLKSGGLKSGGREAPED